MLFIIKTKLTLWSGLILLFIFSHTVQAGKAVYDLAHGCYAIQSPKTGNYLRAGNSTYANNTYPSYSFGGKNLQKAAHFYFQPAGMNDYVLRDKNGQYLAAKGVTIANNFVALIGRVSTLADVRRRPIDLNQLIHSGELGRWRVEHFSKGNEDFYKFILKDVKSQHVAVFQNAFFPRDRSTTFVNAIFIPVQSGTDDNFKLIKLAQQDCAKFPEIEIEKGQVASTAKHNIRGFADSHTHINSHHFLGGTYLHGKPYHPLGVEHALSSGKDYHGGDGGRDYIGNIQTEQALDAPHNVAGYPDFTYWPDYRSLSHQQAYYKWIKRAHLSGLKIMVSHMVENQVLCKVKQFITPALDLATHQSIKLPPVQNSCTPMESVDLQIKDLMAMQDYIDAQNGGPGEGFFRIVTSASEARDVIGAGKLAVFMGIEVSTLFNCLPDQDCSELYLERQLQNYYNKGIRTLFPIHRFDNRFGGASLANSSAIMNFANAGQKNVLFDLIEGSFPLPLSGDFFNAVKCSEEKTGANLQLIDQLELIKIPEIDEALSDALNNILGELNVYKRYPKLKDGEDHCNTMGLTARGKSLINMMIDKKMIIEIDHMSNPAQTEVLDILKARQYSGVISGHNTLKGIPDNDGYTVSPIQKRILQQGGLIFPYNFDAKSTAQTHQKIKQVLLEHNKNPAC